MQLKEIHKKRCLSRCLWYNCSVSKLVLCALCTLVMSCTGKGPESVQLSVKPIGEAPIARSESRVSNIGLRFRIRYQDLAEVVAREVPRVQTGDGQKRMCKRVIGVKVCGTANWQYTAMRTDEITVAGSNDKVILVLPLQFEGTAGIQGDVAKVLGLRKIDFSGALEATIGLSFDLDSDWCPVINTDIDYRWTKAPKAKWAGSFDIDLQRKLDETLAKQLETVDKRIKESIDCGLFRDQLAAQWKQHSFPLELPTESVPDTVVMSPVYLNLQPKSFAFSGMRTEKDSLGATFLLSVKTSVDPNPTPDSLMPLPRVERTDYKVGSTQFELPIRIAYQQLVDLIKPELLGRTFTSSSSAGDVLVLVKSVELFGSEAGLTIGLGFDADLPASRKNTSGIVYLTTLPVVDPVNRTLTLTDTSVSKIIDNTLWNILATVFEGRIAQTIEQRTVIELGKRLEELEETLIEQISNPERTSGLRVSAEQLDVNLLALVPESASLAILLRVNAAFDIDVPAEVMLGEF